jgi:hypothetical protein
MLNYFRVSEQNTAPHYSSKRVPLPRCSIPCYLLKSASQIKFIIPLTTHYTRTHALSIRLLDSPFYQLLPEALTLIIGMHGEEGEVPVLGSRSGPVMRRVGDGEGEKVGFCGGEGAVWVEV